jgi:hypothetical protein
MYVCMYGYDSIFCLSDRAIWVICMYMYIWHACNIHPCAYICYIYICICILHAYLCYIYIYICTCKLYLYLYMHVHISCFVLFVSACMYFHVCIGKYCICIHAYTQEQCGNWLAYMTIYIHIYPYIHTYAHMSMLFDMQTECYLICESQTNTHNKRHICLNITYMCTWI